MAAEGKFCFFLKEECCFSVNKLGKVQENMQEILERPSNLKTSLQFQWITKLWFLITFSFLCPCPCDYSSITFWAHATKITN